MTVLFQNNILPIYDKYHLKCNSILVELFQQCNLACEFCCSIDESGKRATKFDKDTILSFIPLIKRTLPYADQSSKFGICVLGGELYQDRFDYSVYDTFYKQLNEITTGYNCFIYTFSNMIFNDRDRVYDLLSSNNIRLNASFDLVGRYPKQKYLEKAIDNILWFADRPIGDSLFNVCLIANRPNMENIINHGINLQYFDILYNHPNIAINFGDYLPVENKLQYIPDDKLIIEFYKHLYDHYPRVQDLQDLFHHKKKHRCNEIYITQTGVEQWHCSTLTNTYINYKNNFYNTLHCFQCPYFKQCAQMCYKSYYNRKACWKKVIYDRISNSNQIG